MVGIVVVTRAALLIARRASTWTIDEHLSGRSPDCVAVDPRDRTRVYCGTAGDGEAKELHWASGSRRATESERVSSNVRRCQ